jgi:hypothetical protein
MRPLVEKYPFKKFWDAFMRQNRCCSKWDESRTDQDVFIRRTLAKWFEGKYFQVIFDEYVPGDPFPLAGRLDKKESYRIRYTRYMAVIDIYFTFAAYHDQITIRYVEPHSNKIQKMCIKGTDWYNLSVEEDKESFVILRRFYPVEKIEIKLPSLSVKY